MLHLLQVQQNIALFDTDMRLTDTERAVLLSVAQDVIARTNVPCTACHYCEPVCPMSLAIPDLLRRYNNGVLFAKGGPIESHFLNGVEQGKAPGDCIGCEACMAQCPQHIAIPEKLADFAARVK